MLEDLYRRIEEMDWRRPYVWKLRMSVAEFDELEQAVSADTTTPRQNVVYLAEWYKRCYDGGTAKPVREFDAKMLFEDAGIDKTNLFKTESGNCTWLYSLYVLGGVAIPFELGKTDKRFLKELCRLYYGEDGDIDRLGTNDQGRAVAFRESVRTRGCLFEYLQAVLLGFESGALPFADDDLKDEHSQANEFIQRIREANKEVLGSKFDLEWVITTEPTSEFMTRQLRLVLKPESLGGVNHQYLGFDRVREWKVPQLEKCRYLVIGARFKMDDVVIAEPDYSKPMLEYSNTGNLKIGFVAWGTERHSAKIEAPTEKFNAVEIVARDDSGGEYHVETFEVEEWLHVFRVPDRYNEWASQNYSQRVAAVICPGDYFIHEEGLPATIFKKRFRGKGGAISEVYQWRSIVDKVLFSDPNLNETTLFNRQGYDQIVAVPHQEILRYCDGLVAYSEKVDGEIEESYLPLVFGRPDIIVRHFETRNDLTDDSSETEYDYEKIEFKDGGQYREWTDDCSPQQGKITLRITVKGVPRKFVVYFLPKTICRNCENGEILCEGEVLEKFQLVKDGTPTDPVFHKSFGTDEEFVSLEIWHPTTHKEIVRNGRVVQYVAVGESAEISYALKDGLTISDFGTDGYREYDCGDIGNIYALPEFSPIGDHHLAAFEAGEAVFVAPKLDVQAPVWLRVNLAKKFAKTSNERTVYWNYQDEAPPREIQDENICHGNDIVFHSLRDYCGVCVRSINPPEPDPFAFNDDSVEYDLVSVFDHALEHQIYFFLMQPLREAHDHNCLYGLREVIRERRGGELTDEDIMGLRRLAEEFGFDWRKGHGINDLERK